MNAPIRSALTIAPDHPAYAGHFPSFPVLPGAVLLDTVLIALEHSRQIDATQWQISVAKFLSVVRPGDPLELEHEMTANGSIRFTISNDDRPIATGTLSPRPQAATR